MTRPTGAVLVVGDNDLAGLTTVRSLGRAGLDVALVSFEPSPITRSSRYVRAVHRLGNPLDDPHAFADRVLDLVRRRTFDLVLPTSDRAMLPLLAVRDELDRHSRLAAPDDRGVHATHRKDATLALARSLGIDVPATELLESPEALAGWVRPSTLPIALKPCASVQLGQKRRNEVVIVRSMDDLEILLPRLLRAGPVLVQEFCPGTGVGLNVLARDGEIVAAFQHSRVHEPPSGGASSYRRSEPLSEDLLSAARRFCAELRWTGPAMLEFKRDPHTGRTALMEVNGRLWGSLALAVQAGVDFPRLIYQLFVHGSVRPVFRYRVALHVRHTVRDLYWLRENLRTPAGRPDLLRLAPGAVLGEVRHLLLGREGMDLECLDDPMPALMAYGQFGREVVHGVARGLNNLRRRWQSGRLTRRVRTNADRLSAGRKILFLCSGNINRSAVAAQALGRLLPESVEIVSAGTRATLGVTSGPVSRRAAESVGVDLTAHRSQPLTAELLGWADVIIGMESDHLAGAIRLAPDVLERCHLLGAFDPEGQGPEIPDPDGQAPGVYVGTYERVLRCVQGLAGRLSAAALQSLPQGTVS